MTIVSSETLHASCVAIGGRAVLIDGPSGSGKSDLALRLIDRGANLVSDDYTVLRRREGRLFAFAPSTIAGRIEVRGVGIVTMPFVEDVPVAMIIRIGTQVERLPQQAETMLVAAVAIPCMAIAPFEPSAPIKVELTLQSLGQPL